MSRIMPTPSILSIRVSVSAMELTQPLVIRSTGWIGSTPSVTPAGRAISARASSPSRTRARAASIERSAPRPPEITQRTPASSIAAASTIRRSWSSTGAPSFLAKYPALLTDETARPRSSTIALSAGAPVSATARAVSPTAPAPTATTASRNSTTVIPAGQM